MKYLGVDFGSKKIGLAKSDDSAVFAFPLEILKNTPTKAEETLKILEREGIQNIVIGRSVDLQGKDNDIEKEVAIYIEDIKKLNSDIEIHRFDERFTTAGSQAVLRSSFIQNASNTKHKAQQAKEIRKHTKEDDAQTAAYMLQGFLDMKRGV